MDVTLQRFLRLAGVLAFLAVLVLAQAGPVLAESDQAQADDESMAAESQPAPPDDAELQDAGTEDSANQQDDAQAQAADQSAQPPVDQEPDPLEVTADKAMLEAAEDDLDYALSLLGGSGQAFDPARVADLAALVLARKDDQADFNPVKRDDATSAYGQMVIHVELEKLLKYMFNPRVPSYLIMPSLVRLGGWRNQADADRVLAGIWNRMPFDEPTIFRGVEYEVTTPSLEVGSYYVYDLNRALIFFTYKGRNALLSLTRMVSQSEVGKKGVAIGDPDEWIFFYSQTPGSMSGLADMVDTYIYDSVTVNLFIEKNPGARQIIQGTFKWLKAGGGIFKDMVGESDIRGGMESYWEIVRDVLESPSLPSTLAIRDYADRVRDLSDDQLRELLKPFSLHLVELAKQGGDMADSDFSTLIDNGGYVDSLSREEMESELLKRFMYAKLHGQTPASLPEPGDAAVIATGEEVEPVDEPPVHLVPELYGEDDATEDDAVVEDGAVEATDDAAATDDATVPEDGASPADPAQDDVEDAPAE